MTEPAYLTATRSGYDAIAERCAGPFRAALDDAPLDRALLAAFAEMVRRDHSDPLTLEVGSGHGGTAAFLAELGLTVSGADLSPAMVEFARRSYPDIGFRVGAMHALDVDDASLAGLVPRSATRCRWTSIGSIRTPSWRRSGRPDSNRSPGSSGPPRRAIGLHRSPRAP